MSLTVRNAQTLRKAQEVASYYGFNPIPAPPCSRDDKQCAKPLQDLSCHTLDKHMDRKISILRHYIDKKLTHLPRPVMLSYRTTVPRARMEEVHLDIIDNSRSISEALLLRAATAILSEEGHKNICVHVNSFGDKESFATFEAELNQFIRKHINELTPDAQQEVKQNPFSLFMSHNEGCRELSGSAPKPINFLSDPSRVHFKEMLEYIDNFGIPYEIDNTLVGNRHYGGETLFDIRTGAPGNILGHGLRYNTLVKKMGYRRDVPATGLTLTYRPKRKKLPTKKSLDNLAQRKFYFVHLGLESRIKSFEVIESLRRAHIPVHHGLTKHKCENQMSLAKKYNPEYLIIMGIKEALENSVIIRNTETRTQKTIPVSELVPFLRQVA